MKKNVNVNITLIIFLSIILIVNSVRVYLSHESNYRHHNKAINSNETNSTDDINIESFDNQLYEYKNADIADVTYIIQPYGNFSDDFKNKFNHTTYDIEIEINKINQTTLGQDTVLMNKNYCSFKKDIKVNQTEIKEEGRNFSETNMTSTISNQIDSVKQISNTTGNYTNSDPANNLLLVIADQTESIKKEICSNCLEISNALDIIINEVKKIKFRINLLMKKTFDQKQIILRISHAVNNINFIKADLFKLNVILNSLQKVNCPNYQINSKKYQLVVNSTNKLIEIIQDVIKKLKINVNLVILN
jgi:hypothetical protein